jgi:RsmE family RNA methyltransferase
LNPKVAFAGKEKRKRLLVGPEGGFTSDEAEQLDLHATQVDLGPHNLRVATAAVVATGLALNAAEPI